jgi:hypothetical protein
MEPVITSIKHLEYRKVHGFLSTGQIEMVDGFNSYTTSAANKFKFILVDFSLFFEVKTLKVELIRYDLD